MPSPSKTKGNSFERQTAEFLTNLYGEKFIRAPGSGAYVGGKNTFRKDSLHEAQIRNFKSDIVPGESFPKLNIECKSYKDFPFHQLFKGEVKILETWIEQCITAADDGDFSIIAMKFNRKGTYVAIQVNESTKDLQLTCYINYTSKKNGVWALMDHDSFWDLNADTVKRLSSAA